MLKKILLAVGLLVGSAFAQGGAASGEVRFPNGQTVPYATVRVCLTPANGVPCSNLATIFTDATLGVGQTNPISLTPLNFGAYSFGAAQGNYTIQVSGPGYNTASFPVTFGIPSGTSIINLTITGVLTLSGATITGGTYTGSTFASPTINTPTINSPTITNSFSPDGSGHKHIRVASCTTGAGANATCPTTVTWVTPFASTTYTLVCQLSSNNVTATVTSETAASRLAASAVINITNGSGGGATSGTLDCIADHD